eukprot:TRINITY_DN28020_c0_g1_i3.p1 TRINITY_DN28020_c0_g1~~TRINITY_DN28020_c0_g1_i3.p1  ORF type:complete len:243 (-),score=50.46 TRINITY_DN28020_c0_g1_i3:343-1071(-)
MAECGFIERAAGEHGAEDAFFAYVKVNVEGKTFPECASALAAGSPVLRAMLVSPMKEGVTKVIDLPGKSAAEYAIFRQFFRTRAAINSGALSIANVDAMLPWFHEYQMSKMLRESEEIVMNQPVTTERLVQAYTYDLVGQYKRCLESVAERFADMYVGGLESHPQIMADLLAALKEDQAKKARDAQDFKKGVGMEIEDLRGTIVVWNGSKYCCNYPADAQVVLEEYFQKRTNFGLYSTRVRL